MLGKNCMWWSSSLSHFLVWRDFLLVYPCALADKRRGLGREGERQPITAKHWISVSEGFKPQWCLRWKNSGCSQSHACLDFWPDGAESCCSSLVLEDDLCGRGISDSQAIRVPATEEWVGFSESCGMLAAVGRMQKLKKMLSWGSFNWLHWKTLGLMGSYVF